jgi:cytochrome P450
MKHMTEQLSTQSGAHPCPHLANEYHPLTSPQLDNPYSFYMHSRSEKPIFFDEEINAWVITRYNDIKSILLQPEIFSSKDTMRPIVKFAPEVLQVLKQGYRKVPETVNSDGINHLRFRTPLNKVFSPPRMKAMAPTIRKVVNKLIDEFINDGEAEIMTQFANLLPLEIILLLYDIPLARMDDCKRWCTDMHGLISAPLSPERQLECAQSRVEFHRFIGQMIEERRKALGEDVISLMLTIHYDHAQPLDEDELVRVLSATLLAGHETTALLIGNALYLLHKRPELWQKLCEQPNLIPNAIEEVLRYDGSIHAFHRTALQEVEVGGVTIPAGSLLLLVYGSANHDETQFTNPELFDISRSPNRHLSFGHGIHFCVGAPLARLEAQIALEVLSQRLPHLRLKPEQSISYIPRLLMRGLTKLELEWDIS